MELHDATADRPASAPGRHNPAPRGGSAVPCTQCKELTMRILKFPLGLKMQAEKARQ
jgi:hypothetical protein